LRQPCADKPTIDGAAPFWKLVSALAQILGGHSRRKMMPSVIGIQRGEQYIAKLVRDMVGILVC
jgi:hypothetical protein